MYNSDNINPVMMENVKIYYGNIVYPDGTICNAVGEKLKVSDKGILKGTVRICIDGTIRTIRAGRIVYAAFHNIKLDRSHVIIYKDGNIMNPALDNLEMVERKEYFKDHDWGSTGIRKALTTEQEMELIRLQRNGMYNPETDKMDCITYEELAKMYHISKSTVYNIIKRNRKEG